MSWLFDFHWHQAETFFFNNADNFIVTFLYLEIESELNYFNTAASKDNEPSKFWGIFLSACFFFLGSLLLYSLSQDDMITSGDFNYLIIHLIIDIFIFISNLSCAFYFGISFFPFLVFQFFFLSCILLNWLFFFSVQFFPCASLEITNSIFIILWLL